MHNNQQGKINIRGVDHYYEWVRKPNPNHQPKPVMIFVHGWGGSCRYWRTTAEAISSDFDCLLYDLRGFGNSSSSIPREQIPREQEAPTPLLSNNNYNLTYEIEEYAEDLLVLLDTFNLEKVYINAHSMGASVAIFFLNLAPKRVEKAILNCNGVFPYDERAFTAFHKFGGYVVKFRYNWFLKVPFADQFFMARFLNRPIPKDFIKAFLEDFLLADYQAALGTIYTSVSKKAAEIMPKEFAKIEVPTILISGEKDQITPASMAKEAALLNDKISYVEIPATAHFPMLEDAPTYLKVIQEFLYSE
jgi:pimeloyl-ACP methyl ester carboxylesterase